MVVRGTLRSSAICWTVRSPGVVELLREGDLVGVEFGWAAACAAASAGGGESVAGVGDDQLALELGEHGEHPGLRDVVLPRHPPRPGRRGRLSVAAVCRHAVAPS